METYRQRRCGKGGGDSGHVFFSGIREDLSLWLPMESMQIYMEKVVSSFLFLILIGSFLRSYGQHSMVPSSTHGGWHYIYSASDSSTGISYYRTMFLVVLVVCARTILWEFRTRNFYEFLEHKTHFTINSFHDSQPHLGHFFGGGTTLPTINHLQVVHPRNLT